MYKKIVFGFLAAALLAAACRDNAEDTGTVALNFKATYQDEPLQMLSSTYVYPDGTPMRLQVFNYYLSDITLLREDGSEGKLLSEVELVDFSGINTAEAAANGIEKSFKDIPAGTYTGIRVGLGVAPELNATQPGDYPAGHPLTGNYWLGLQSYVFAKIEANADVNGDGQFDNGLTYHIGKTDLYKTLTFNTTMVVEDGKTTSITFLTDLYDMIADETGNYLDITDPSNTIDHGVNPDIYGFLWNNLSATIGVQQ